MTYSKKLLDPRWQKRRLDILSRDEFTCRNCGSGDITLHVHHRYYINGRQPWEYPDFALITLCVDCHKNKESNFETFDSLPDIEAVMELLGDGVGGGAAYFASTLVSVRRALNLSHSKFQQVISYLQYCPDLVDEVEVRRLACLAEMKPHGVQTK